MYKISVITVAPVWPNHHQAAEPLVWKMGLHSDNQRATHKPSHYGMTPLPSHTYNWRLIINGTAHGHSQPRGSEEVYKTDRLCTSDRLVYGLLWTLASFSHTYSQQRCCYITVNFATAASENRVFLTQEMCHILMLFCICYIIKKFK
jgi:hypothetical protein